MALPSLHQWDATRDALHQAAQVIGALRVAAHTPLPNDLHVSLHVTARGLRTGPLAIGGEFTLDFPTSAVIYSAHAEVIFSVQIAGHTQISLMDAILKALRDVDQVLVPRRQKIVGDRPLMPDLGLARDYAQVMDRIYTALARVKARLAGAMTPLVLWPHHFDLSFLWFVTGKTDEHQDPHMNFGFAPISEGFPRPYVYSYAWPMTEGVSAIQPASPSRWHRDGWIGVVLDYDDLKDANQPEALIEDVLWHFHSQAAPLMVGEKG